MYQFNATVKNEIVESVWAENENDAIMMITYREDCDSQDVDVYKVI